MDLAIYALIFFIAVMFDRVVTYAPRVEHTSKAPTLFFIWLLALVLTLVLLIVPYVKM